MDSIPPEIVSVNPPSGTLQFKGGGVEIEFSEFMDEKSVSKAVSVSPFLDEPLKRELRSKTLLIDFPTKLDSHFTYVMTLSRDLKDEHGVPLAEPVQIAYSTGDNIDKGELAGTVFGDGNFSVHLWKMDHVNPIDSIFATRPQFISDAADNGSYRFEFLSPGDYLLLATESQTAGLTLNPARMSYGLPWRRSISLKESETVSGINMITFNERPPLRLLRGEWNGPNWGRLIFNQSLGQELGVKSITLMLDPFEPFIGQFIVDPLNETHLVMFFTDSIPSGSSMIFIDQMKIENSMRLDEGELSLRIPEDYDTTFIKWVSPNSDIEINPERNHYPEIDFVLSAPVSMSNDLENYVRLITYDSSLVDVKVIKKSPMHFVLQTQDDWNENAQYYLQVLGAGFNPLFGNSHMDSVSEFTMKTGKQIGYGSLMGSLKGNIEGRFLVDSETIEKKPQKFTAVVNSAAEFIFKDIPEGMYTLTIYEDKDQNGHYSNGSAFPHNPAEWFQVVPDTFEVRANWDTEVTPITLEGIE